MLKSLIKNASGSFALKTALLAPILLLSTGVAVDTSRLMSAKQKLQYSVDASALSGAVAFRTDEDDYKDIARTAFDTNLDNGFQTIDYDIDKTVNETLVVDAQVRLNPMFVQIFGYPKLETRVSAEVNIGISQTTEVVLVVDHSASLLWNNGYAPLSAALDVFMNTISDQNDMGNLYVSFIPWSGTVNVGDTHASWLNSYDNSIFGSDDWHGCVMARPNGLDLTDDAPTGTGQFDPFAWPSDQANNWAGQPSANFSDYSVDQTDITLGPNAGCSVEMVPLTNKRHQILPAIDEYQTHIQNKVGTFTAHAMIWGYRALSPKWQGHWNAPTPSNLPSNDGNKIIVFLSDGFANWNDVETPAIAHYSPYGYASENYLNVSDTTDEDTIRAEMEQRFSTVCETIKDDGIEIYTIGYAMDASLVPIYENCATSPDHFFHAPANGEISTVFSNIATSVKEQSLRIMN